MKLSDYRDEEALDVLADLIEPASEIFSDKEIKAAAESGKRAAAVSVAIKRHKKAVIAILAALNRTPVEEYHCGIFTLPVMLGEMFNDPNVLALFTSAGRMVAQTPSGSLSENIAADAQ